MAALTAEVNLFHKGTPTKLAMKSTGADTFYKGAIVYIDVSNNTGLVQVGSVAAGDVFAGICAETKTTTATDLMVDVYVDGLWAFPVAATAATDIGSAVISDTAVFTDNPADLINSVDATLAANDILIGITKSIDTEETSMIWTMLMPGFIWSATLGWVTAI